MEFGGFPVDTSSLKEFKLLYEFSRGFVVKALPVIVIGRTIITMLFSKGSDEYISILRDLLIASFLLGSFVYLMQGITDMPALIHKNLAEYATYKFNTDVSKDSFVDGYLNSFLWLMLITQQLGYAIYYVVLALTFAFGAYIIIAGTILQSYWVLKATFWMLVCLSSWPIIWYILNMLGHIMSNSEMSVNSFIIIGILHLAKLLVPLITLMKIWDSSPVKTAASAMTFGKSKAIQAFSLVKKTGNSSMNFTMGKTKAQNVRDSFSQSTKTMSALGKAVGSVATEKVRDGISKTSSAVHSKTVAIMPKSAQVRYERSVSSVSKFGHAFKNQFESVPLSSPVGQKLQKIAPRVHAKAVEIIRDNKDQPISKKPMNQPLGNTQRSHNMANFLQPMKGKKV